jgi:hypothetical protein
MSQHTEPLARLLAYVEERSIRPDIPPLDVSGCDLSGADLRGLDFTNVNLSGGDLSHSLLDGARLQGAILKDTCFEGVRIAVLQACGLSPKDILQHRCEANSVYPTLHFSSEGTGPSPLKLLAKECVLVCQHLGELTWEAITDERVFGALYAEHIWDDWLATSVSRSVLEWALVHRATLNRYMERVPFYGRVLPLTLLDEVEPADLVAGSKTNPERVMQAVGLRQIVKQSDLQGENVSYPLSPFGDAECVVQIKCRRELQLEGGYMHHCVASYDQSCLAGQRFIYHLGPPAPSGSTLEMFPSGVVGQHRAEHNYRPSTDDRDLLTRWLDALGLKHEAGSLMERVCGRLRQEAVAKVTFQIYYDNDQDYLDDLCAEDAGGNSIAIQTVSDDDLWEFAHEVGGGDAHGQWELDVEAQLLQWVGEEQPPDDEYDDEDYDEDEELEEDA